MGIATYRLRLAARNTPSGSPRFLALPVLTFPLIVPNRAYCDGVRRYSMMKLAPSALSLRRVFRSLIVLDTNTRVIEQMQSLSPNFFIRRIAVPTLA